MNNTPKTVLIVEDEKDLAGILVDRFSSAGFHTLIAHDGEEGLKMAKEHKPDLILLDILMPKMDGIDMLKKLRKEKVGETLPAVILTNLSDPEKMTEAAEESVHDYWIKADHSLDDLIHKIKEKFKP